MALRCWEGGFSFEQCCELSVVNGVLLRGQLACWSEGYNYDTCCVPELDQRYERIGEVWASRDTEGHRLSAWDKLKLSQQMLDLKSRYDTEVYLSKNESWKDYVFVEIARSVRDEFVKEAENLTWPEFVQRSYGLPLTVNNSVNPNDVLSVIGHGGGIGAVWEFWEAWCQAYLGAEDTPSDPCMGQNADSGVECSVTDFIEALPPSRLRVYNTFSEQLPFRIFTHSIFHTDPAYAGLEEAEVRYARKLDGATADALSKEVEPVLGRVWADIGGFLPSRKHKKDLLTLSALAYAVRPLVSAAAKDLEVLEIGGGYGSLLHRAASAPVDAFPFRLRRWTIFDLAYVSQLQAWYLHSLLARRANVSISFVHGSPWQPGGSLEDADSGLSIRLVASKQRELFFHAHRQLAGALRVCVAVDSLSELSSEEFLRNLHFIADRFAAQMVVYRHNDKLDERSQPEARLRLLREAGFEEERLEHGLVIFRRKDIGKASVL
eukprot:TRINITY_DN73730_c0_g1_i1.p1 TRINITY_DN73730_c0_g1~~TRINITY_DN73730_c0_g1_i1.p1  ORF type:complete len:491 (-),score=99.30 TRINITY_DN73730_c0_g1_i1:100-1572(-)